MNYLPTCTSRLVVQHLYQVLFKSIQGCRRRWEDKLWWDGMTEGRTKQTLSAPLAILWRGHKNERYAMTTPVERVSLLQVTVTSQSVCNRIFFLWCGCGCVPNVTRHSGWWPHTVTPSIDRTLHQFLTITDLDLITDFDFLPNCARFP